MNITHKSVFVIIEKINPLYRHTIKNISREEIKKENNSEMGGWGLVDYLLLHFSNVGFSPFVCFESLSFIDSKLSSLQSGNFSTI